MAGHVFHEIFLHLNWHTKDDLPLLTPDLEPIIHEYIREKCGATRGVYFHAVGGTETHVHLAINIEPSVCVSDFLGELKGMSSHETNKHTGRKAVEWQRGYGVVSFNKRDLHWVIQYIENQKSHHAHGTLSRKLELTFDTFASQVMISEEDVEKPG